MNQWKVFLMQEMLIVFYVWALRKLLSTFLYIVIIIDIFGKYLLIGGNILSMGSFKKIYSLCCYLQSYGVFGLLEINLSSIIGSLIMIPSFFLFNYIICMV
jgi:hypothetical protein